ncbi:MAG: multiheme c-type cytochrome [Candidatus Thiodiazotropha sp.]
MAHSTRRRPNSGIGRINPDSSKGSCSACHGHHAFSKAQAREPSACIRCHAGPPVGQGDLRSIETRHNLLR